jgi:hypothetical protein
VWEDPEIEANAKSLLPGATSTPCRGWATRCGAVGRVGFDGVPRVLDTDEWRREVLSYVPWHTPDRASPEVATERVLAGVGRLLRRYHEAARGFELPVRISWHYPRLPGARTVVCHNDVSPRNTVLRGGRPVAFLD